jgi:hypothetical protein
LIFSAPRPFDGKVKVLLTEIERDWRGWRVYTERDLKNIEKHQKEQMSFLATVNCANDFKFRKKDDPQEKIRKTEAKRPGTTTRQSPRMDNHSSRQTG